MIVQKEIDEALMNDFDRQMKLEKILVVAIDEIRSGFAKLYWNRTYEEEEAGETFSHYRARMESDVKVLRDRILNRLGDLQNLFARTYKGSTYEIPSNIRVPKQPPFRKIGPIGSEPIEVPNLLD